MPTLSGAARPTSPACCQRNHGLTPSHASSVLAPPRRRARDPISRSRSRPRRRRAPWMRFPLSRNEYKGRHGTVMGGHNGWYVGVRWRRQKKGCLRRSRRPDRCSPSPCPRPCSAAYDGKPGRSQERQRGERRICQFWGNAHYSYRSRYQCPRHHCHVWLRHGQRALRFDPWFSEACCHRRVPVRKGNLQLAMAVVVR